MSGIITIGIILLITQITLTIVFQWIESSLKKKIQIASVSFKTSKPPSESESSPATEKPPHHQNEQEDLDPTYVELINCRKCVKELKESPHSFVEYAKRSRELIKLEKRWKLIYNGLSKAEQHNYDSLSEIQSNNGHHQKSPSSLTSRFAQVMDPTLTAEQKSDLYQNLLGEFFSGNNKNTTNIPPQVKKHSQILNSLSLIKFFTTWLVIHLVVGYSPSINTVPLVAVESSFFRPWGILGKSFFNLLPPDSVKTYIMGDPNISDLQFTSTPQTCRHYWSLGLMGSMFILNQAISHAKKSFFDSNGTFPTGIRYLVKTIIHKPNLHV